MNNNNNNKQPLYLTDSLLDRAKKGENRGKQPSICKVSRILRDDNEIFFTPQLVSIGPIHSGDPKLQEFEWLKECYLNDLLNRCHDSTPRETLEACLLKVYTSIHQIRESYAGMKNNYKDDELATMMVMDGCFILEFCFKHKDKDSDLPNDMETLRIAMDLMLLENQVPFFVLQALFDCLPPGIFKPEKSFTLTEVLDTHLAPYIKLFRSDLLPEKKSIPRKVLDKYLAPYIKLFEKNSTTDVDSNSTHVLLSKGEDSEAGEHLAQQANMPGHVDSDSTHDHVLGYMHKLYQLVDGKSANPIHAEASKKGVYTCIPCVPARSAPAVKTSEPKHAEASKPVDEELAAKSSNPTDAEELKLIVDEERIENTAFHSIVELDRSGMNFKPHQEDEWSMTIKFQPSLFPCLLWSWSKPTLLMPTLVIYDITELILRNFIAYEQSFPKDRYYFTSYAKAMDMLINTQEDIAKLVESKVLVNNLGSNQEAAEMINKICKNISITDFYYTQEFKQMDTYYNGVWPKNIAFLRRVYFSNPWSTIALFGAIILFILTVVSTIFTVLQYFG